MTSVTVNLDTTNITVAPVVKTVVQAFPAGLKGDKGDAGTSFSYTVDSNLGNVNSYTILASSPTGLKIADKDDITCVGNVVGVTSQSSVIGAPVEIITSGGILIGLTGLSVGEKYYLGSNGQLTATLPTTGFIQQIGVAISTTQIAINILTSISL